MELTSILIIFLVALVWMYGSRIQFIRRERNKLRDSLMKNYGKDNTRQFKKEEVEHISYYSELRNTDDSIDSLTWNDLSMDEIFKKMAYTRSSIGDDYLYYLLKNPKKNKYELEKMEEKISCFQMEEESRVSLQMLFSQLGRVHRFSLSAYIEYLLELTPKNNWKHYLAIIGIIISALIMMGNVGVGVVCLIVLLSYNGISYYKEKTSLEPCLVSFRYILKVLSQSREIPQLLPRAWEKEKEELQEIQKVLRKWERNSFLVMSPGRLAGEGLEVLLDYLRICLHIDIIKFNRMLGYLQKNSDTIWHLYEIIGSLDAYIAIGEYRASLPFYSLPAFSSDREVKIEEGYHPLIEHPVSNSITISRNLLITGSNASGKSTFLKMVGVNILLSQTIHTAAAKSFCLPLCKLYTSMSLKDNLSGQESYYMAEIRAIKRILDAAKEGLPVICMVDEVLRGTNTIERIAASTQILRTMIKEGILCLAATHDIELTRILDAQYCNYHFEETFCQGDIQFSYLIYPGPAFSSNAIDLLEQMGYDKTLIQEARNMIRHFKEKGEWV